MPRSPEWVYTQMLQIETDLHAQNKLIVGAPNHAALAAANYAYQFGRLQHVVDVCIREGVALSPTSTPGIR